MSENVLAEVRKCQKLGRKKVFKCQILRNSEFQKFQFLSDILIFWNHGIFRTFNIHFLTFLRMSQLSDILLGKI